MAAAKTTQLFQQTDTDNKHNTWRWPCEAKTCRRLIENKKLMCYIDGQNNKYLLLFFQEVKELEWVAASSFSSMMQMYTYPVKCSFI
jgi:hypothetical protein